MSGFSNDALLSAGAAIIAAVIYFFQLRTMNRQLNAYEKSLNLSKVSSENELRAYLSITNNYFEMTSPNSAKIKFNLCNTGRTPAKSIEHEIRAGIYKENFNWLEDLNKSGAPFEKKSGIISPNSFLQCEIPITITKSIDINSEKLFYKIDIKYKDWFDNDRYYSFTRYVEPPFNEQKDCFLTGISDEMN